MADETAPIEAKAPKPVIDLLRENLILIASLAAIVYGLGWIAESTMQSVAGLGQIEISHQRATAAGLTFFAILTAQLMVFNSLYILKAHDPMIGGLSFTLGCAILGLTAVQSTRHFRIPTDVFGGLVWLALGATVACNVVFAWVFRQYRDQSRKGDSDVNLLRFALITLAFFVLCPSLFAFGIVVLPALPEFFGGPENIEVVLFIKDTKKPATGLLILSDDKTIILGPATFPDSAEGTPIDRVTRIPWDRVDKIERVPTFSSDSRFETHH